jgi:hypothetical protein
VRLVDIARLVAWVVLILVIPFVAAQRRLVRTLERSAATTPDRAVRDEGRLYHRLARKRLLHAGVLQEAPSGGVYLELRRLEAWRRRRRWRALVAVSLVLAASAVVFYLNR